MNTHRRPVIHTPWTIRSGYAREAARIRNGHTPTHRREGA